VARIEGVALHRRTIDLRRPFVTAIRTAHSIDVLLVEVFDSDGRSGWGEAPTSWRVTGESIESVSAAVLGPLIEAVKGHSSEDPAATSTALARAVALNSSARMALDCALYDLAARAADVPLFHYLGGSSDEVRTDMTLSAVVEGSETDALCRTAREFIDAGFGALKVKVGAGGDDVRTLTRVRDVAGPDVQLRIDANQGWSREEAIRVISTLEDAGVGIEFAEQPVDRDDIDALAFVTAHVQTPIVADEAVWNRRDLREVIKTHAADMINVKLAKTGGLGEGVRRSQHRGVHGGKPRRNCRGGGVGFGNRGEPEPRALSRPRRRAAARAQSRGGGSDLRRRAGTAEPSARNRNRGPGGHLTWMISARSHSGSRVDIAPRSSFTATW
jgi:L-alanine-DL-glutamate epimerase-like enolase superfamily enzyme